ncbi:unnamed protein product [Parnassius apollo]|uniref:(apollo) hypothetical protein n=1 Tax=Parnassius apollo TaxID=110799 RepID=A0A8S3WHG3_PARAO|nr:unnamed protein product [Parnassius apollo]
MKMERMMLLIISPLLISTIQLPSTVADGTVLSAILTPKNGETLQRQERSYYERYGARRPLYDRLEYDRSSSCRRCDDRYDDRDDDSDDYDRGRDSYDDDRRSNHRPTSGSKHDKNDYDDDDRRYSNDRNNGQKNSTEDGNDNDKRRPHDDKDRHSGGRRGNRNRNRHDDRDRYRPDYYDRFLRDPYRDRYDRPYYDDPYRERRPYYDRYYPEPNRYDDRYGSRYDGYEYTGYRRPYYDDRYDRGGTYNDPYGGYGPGVGRGQHDSFRPWDETYRGQAGWDAGGRGYYFASGRPETGPSQYWGRPEYSRPQSSGWQSVGYSSGNRDPVDYRSSFGYAQTGGYRQDLSSGYGQASGWQSVGERRPYRDQSGVAQLDNNESDGNRYGQGIGRQPSYSQHSNYPANSNNYGLSSTTSYLYEREDSQVTVTPANDTNQATS